MTDNNQQIDIKEKIGTEHKPSVTKRALMKGAAAVPVVLTLRSGAAFAKVSTGSCVIRDNKNAGNIKPATLIGANSHDTWVRRTGYCTELKRFFVPTTSKPASSGMPSRVSTVNPSSSVSSSGTASPSRPAIPSRSDSAGPSSISALPSGELPFLVYTEEDPKVNPNTLWQHELNTPEGALLGTTSPNETFVIFDKDLMESADRRGEGQFFEYGNITRCEILVHIGPDTVLSNPSNFKIGAVNVLDDGVSLPHITGSCWASVGPDAVSPSRR